MRPTSLVVLILAMGLVSVVMVVVARNSIDHCFKLFLIVHVLEILAPPKQLGTERVLVHVVVVTLNALQQKQVDRTGKGKGEGAGRERPGVNKTP